MIHKHNWRIGGSILLFLFLFIAIGPLLSPYRFQTVDMSQVLLPPFTHGHLLGTDRVGNDLLTSLMFSGRVSLSVAFYAVIVELLLGTSAGLLAGYLGGVFDRVFTVLIDVMLSLPTLPILLLAGALSSDFSLEGGTKMMFVGSLIGLLSSPSCARLVRGQAMQLRSEPFVVFLCASGLPLHRILLRHLLPNIVPQLAVTAALGVGDAIIAESVLSFLGLGINAPQASWGSMIRAMTRPADFQNRPWLWLGASICIFLSVLGFTLIGEAIHQKGEIC